MRLYADSISLLVIGWRRPQRPFAGPSAVLAYLSRYTHRVAIANSRLLALEERGVSFRWKDYRAKGKTRYKAITLSPEEFMRRCLLHVLPSGFQRIRHYVLVCREIEGPAAARHLGITVRRGSKPSAPARRFLDFLRAAQGAELSRLRPRPDGCDIEIGGRGYCVVLCDLSRSVLNCWSKARRLHSDRRRSSRKSVQLGSRSAPRTADVDSPGEERRGKSGRLAATNHGATIMRSAYMRRRLLSFVVLGLWLSGLATAAPPVSGSITETVSESPEVDGALFVGVVLGELPTKFTPKDLRLAVADVSRRTHCLQLSSSDGVYAASGQLTIEAKGLLPLGVPGFSRVPDVVSAYSGDNVTGMLTPRADCPSSTEFDYIQALYFKGDKRQVHVAINGGNALSVALVATGSRGKSAAACRRVSGRTVAFNFWCDLTVEPTPDPVRLELTRTIGDGPRRTDAITLRVPGA